MVSYRQLKQRAFAAAAALGVAGQCNYRRFIILGRGRSGSNLLATSLDSHPAVVTFGELFNNVSYREGTGINWAYPGYPNRDARNVHLRLNAPLEFIDRKVFAPMPSAVHAVGFKLFYFHAQEPEWAPVWDHLYRVGVGAVHLKRRNLLASLVSAEVAKRTHKWHKRKATDTGGDDDGTGPPLQLDPEACITYFERTDAHQRNFAERFPDRIDLYYEDLVADYEGTTNRVQDFLGVPRTRLTSPLKKQANRPLDQRIANYHDLAHHCRGTQWEKLFEDPTAY